MTTTNNGFDIEIQEALQNNVSSVTYRNTENTPTIQMKAFIDRELYPNFSQRSVSVQLN